MAPGSISLSPDALKNALLMQQEEPAYAGQSLRLYLEGKGCDGFYYGVTFDQPSHQDLSFEAGGLTIICDPDTLQYCAGSVITWVDDDRGRGFLVENPNHRKFRGKFYKRQAWQEKLTQRP